MLILFLHLLGAIVMGYYLLLPFAIGKLAGLSGDTRRGFISALRMMNTIVQFVLIVQLFTGGLLMSNGGYSVPWMVVTVVLLVLIGAFGGMLGRPMKRVSTASVDSSPSDIRRIRVQHTCRNLIFAHDHHHE